MQVVSGGYGREQVHFVAPNAARLSDELDKFLSDAVNIGYQSNSILDNNNYYKQGASADIGSQIKSNNDILLTGNNISGTAASISSTTGGVGIRAEGNVNFKEGRSTNNLSTAVKTTDSGFLSKKTTQDRLDAQSDKAITSNIEGNTVSIQAGQNIGLRGTNVASNFGTQLTAGGDIDILAAQNTSSKSSSSQVKKSGLFAADAGLGFTIGRQKTDESNASTSLTHTASNVGAIDGNVIISAGSKYQQTGSNLIAGMGVDSDKDINDPNRGNTVIRAKQINIDSVTDIDTNQSETKFKQTGLTVSVSNSLIDSAQSIDRLIEAGGNTESMRMKGMAGAAGLLKAKALAKEANSAGYNLLDNGVNADSLKGLGNTRIQATIGTKKSQSSSSSYTEQNQASNITTNNLALIATGAGTDSNINVNGSNLNVTNDALFQADNDFNLNGVAQNSNTRSTNKSSSTAIGGYADTSGSGGITASASRGKGYANSDSVTYANTQVNIGGITTFDIANDVNGKGVVFNTNKVQGLIRGNVNMESPQDTYTYDSNQKSAGVNLDVDIMGNGKGSSLSVNGAKTNINADSKIVGQQTGIFANEADLVVEGKGTFTGAVFTTSKEAQANGKSNIVFKQGVTSTDIVNTTSYEDDAISVGLSVGKIKDKPQATMNGLGYGTDGDSNSSITKGGVSGYNDEQGIFTTDNRAVLSGKLESVFDASRVTEELSAQSQITKEFGKEAPKAVGDFANTRMKAIIADTTLSNTEKQAAIAKWDEGGVYRVAAHTALGVLGTGSVEGALTTGGVAAAAPTLDKVQANLAKALIDSGMSEDVAKGTASGVVSLALLGAGSAAGLDTSSTVTATNVDANNRQLHPQEAELIKSLALEYARKHGISIEEAEKRLTRGALYNIDVGWKDSIDTYIDDKEIESYQEAFNYINQVKPSDLKAYDWADKIRPEHIKAEMAAEEAAIKAEIAAEVADAKQSYNEDDGSLPSTTLDTITVTATRDPKYTYYIDTENNSFTATEKDFNNEEIFLVDTLGGNTNPNSEDYNEAKALMENSAAIKPSEISILEGIGRDARGAKGTIVGTSTGIYMGVKETLETVVDGANAIGRTVEDLINKPQETINSGISKGQDLFKNAPQIAQEGFNQLEDAAALSNAKLSLYDLQQDAEAKANYKANIAGQIAGGGGVGSAGKQVVRKGSDIIDNVASDIGKGLDGMSPQPATVIGTPNTGGATTITGKSDGNKIGAAETGGAILAIGDAKEGAYTTNPDGSITGSGKGRAISTGKRDDSGNEVYQRDSGGYYTIDNKGVQRTAASPNEHGNTLGDQPAELYCLKCIETGETKKYGETTHGEDRYGAGNQKRYSTDEIEEMGVIYTPLDKGTKKDMHSKQTEMIKQYEQENGKKPDLNKTYQ